MITYPLTFVQADVNGTMELYVGAFGELESTKLCCQEIAVDRVEVVKQVSVQGTSEFERKALFYRCRDMMFHER